MPSPSGFLAAHNSPLDHVFNRDDSQPGSCMESGNAPLHRGGGVHHLAGRRGAAGDTRSGCPPSGHGGGGSIRSGVSCSHCRSRQPRRGESRGSALSADHLRERADEHPLLSRPGDRKTPPFRRGCGGPAGAACRKCRYRIPLSSLPALRRFSRAGASRGSLDASLRHRGAQAQWSVDGEGKPRAAFRLAANLVADVLLLLPPEPGAKEVSDPGPVIFAIDRLDTGLGSTAYGYKYLGTDFEYDYYLELREADSSANRLIPLPDRSGLQIVEWLTRPQDRSTAVRALLLNNDKKCATKIILSRGSWTAPLSITIAPYSLKVVELSYPSDVAREKISGHWDSSDCSGPFERSLVSRSPPPGSSSPPRTRDRYSAALPG